MPKNKPGSSAKRPAGERNQLAAQGTAVGKQGGQKRTSTGTLKETVDHSIIKVIDSISKSTDNSKILERKDVFAAFNALSDEIKSLRQAAPKQPSAQEVSSKTVERQSDDSKEWDHIYNWIRWLGNCVTSSVYDGEVPPEARSKQGLKDANHLDQLQRVEEEAKKIFQSSKKIYENLQRCLDKRSGEKTASNESVNTNQQNEKGKIKDTKSRTPTPKQPQEVGEWKEKYQNAEIRLKRVEKERDELNQKLEPLRAENCDLKSKLNEAKENVEYWKKSLQTNQQNEKGKTKDTKSRTPTPKQPKEVGEWKEKYQNAEIRLKQIENEGDELNQKLESSMAENCDLKSKLKEANENVEYWKNRVSKLAGAKLTHENPRITDLSDPNRPSKLSEQFSEVYDNLWTDTLEKLTKQKMGGKFFSEEEAVKHMVYILTDCYQFCFEKKKEIEKFLIPDVLQNPEANSEVEEIKQFKDLLKRSGVKAAESLRAEDVVEKKESLQRHRNITGEFTTRCLRVCWLMIIQDPPVALFWGNIERGSRIDTDRFAYFTRSGSELDYVVWPALLLHENGPLLKKGVVQPIAKKDAQKNSGITSTKF